jgi:hypothetical protein
MLEGLALDRVNWAAVYELFLSIHRQPEENKMGAPRSRKSVRGMDTKEGFRNNAKRCRHVPDHDGNLYARESWIHAVNLEATRNPYADWPIKGPSHFIERGQLSDQWS